jgi:hypothetical protein
MNLRCKGQLCKGFNGGGEVLIDVTARKILILEITT